jgi:chitinase
MLQTDCPNQGCVDMDLTKSEAAAIRKWAEANTLIGAVHLFGSRAKGMSRADSDVDLALTVDDPNPVQNISRTRGAVAGGASYCHETAGEYRDLCWRSDSNSLGIH